MKATLIGHFHDDNAVANFARKSFGDGAENYTDEQNARLIKFLARGTSVSDWEAMTEQVLNAESKATAHDLLVYARKIPEHWAPFGHPHVSLNIEAPIPIARQMFKHKVGMVESEESRRYISIEPQFYYPEFWRNAADNVKQGSSDQTSKYNEQAKELYKKHCNDSRDLYFKFIGLGVCPEQARFILPLGTEVRWSLTGSLYAFANLYNQRSDSHAQKEIQDLAGDINKIMIKLYPVSWAALTQGEY